LQSMLHNVCSIDSMHHKLGKKPCTRPHFCSNTVICCLLQDISSMPELQILDVSNNQLSTVSGLSSLQKLQDLWLNNNQILELDTLNAELDGCRSTLTCVYLTCNPATRNNPLCKQRMMQWLPNLQQLDADYVRGAP